MFKRFLSLIIAGAIMVSSMAVTVFAVDYGEEYQNQPTKTYSQVFSDVSKGHWAFSYIGEMNQRGVISGYPNGYYYPENNVTRAEFAKLMCVAAGLGINEVSSTSYYDVEPSEWYAPYIETGRYYLSGYSSNGENYYHPNDNALREDIAVALVKLKGYSTTGADESMLKTMFTDYQSISTDARKYVAVALENGLISGYEDNTFRGQDSITRAEAATLLWRAYQYGNGNKTFDDEKETTKEEVKVPVSTPKPTNTPIPEKEVVYDYSIELSSTKLTVDEGDEAKITVELFDENPLGVDYSKFKTECENIEKENSGDKTIVTVTFNTATPGKQNYTFSYKDKSKKLTLVVNEVQKYIWKVETVASKVSYVHRFEQGTEGSGSHYYNLVEAKDSVLYTDGTTLYEANENGSNEILCLDDIEWQGEEQSKKDEFSQRICSYAYNFYDDNIYAIIYQRCNDSITMLYNVTDKEIVCQLDSTGTLDKILGFYKDGTIQTSKGKILNDGAFIKEKYDLYFDKNWIYKNSFYLYEYNSCEGPYMWYELKKFDLSTNSFKEIDADTDEYFDMASTATGCLYKLKDKTIKKMDTNGDSEEVLKFEQVRVDDAAKLDSLNGMVVDSEESIYFYDDNYKSIRKISKIEK